MDRAKSQMAALRAMKAPREPIAALDAYDEAELPSAMRWRAPGWRAKWSPRPRCGRRRRNASRKPTL